MPRYDVLQVKKVIHPSAFQALPETAAHTPGSFRMIPMHGKNGTLRAGQSGHRFRKGFRE